MTAPVRPDTSGQGQPAPTRILSPEEFEAAQHLTPAALAKASFPLMPPVPRDATRVGPETPGTPGTGYGTRMASAVGGMLDHPLATAASLITAPITGAFDAGRYIGQPIAKATDPEGYAAWIRSGGHEVTGKEAAVGAAQAATVGLAGGATRVLTAALEPAVGAAAASLVAKGAVAAGTGAALNPDDPAVGAGLGLGLGAAAHAGEAAVARVKGSTAPLTPQQEAVRQFVRDKVVDPFEKMLAPANRSPEATQAALIIRATTGQAAAAYEQAAFKLDEFRRAVDPLPDADKLGFIDAIEGGQAQPNPEFQAAADVMRRTLDTTRDAIRNLGTGKLENFIEHYFPHIWKDPERAADWVKAGPGASLAETALGGGQGGAAGVRPFEGSKSFLKQRTLPTTADGIAAGLEPVSINPVDLTLLKLREMQRYLTAHQSLHELKDAGLVKYVAVGGEVPDGHVRINDNVATVFGPREGAVQLPEGANIAPEDVRVPGRRIMGEYWAPEPVARVVNNYLSPGLRGNALFDAYRGLGNTLNQAQLGLSAFHLGFTSMDASVSRAALGVEYLADGHPIEGVMKVLTAPFAPVTNAMLGRKVRAAYLNPESASPDMQAIANAVKEAGGRVRMDSFYANSAAERLAEALKVHGNAWAPASWSWKLADGVDFKMAGRAILPAFIETATKPLMEHIVPMQKLGVFADMAQKVLADLPEDATVADRRAALASAWDSVDNRMGQVVYDNLFWHKAFKDLSMASVRSVGWNLGTIRELGGGLVDATKAVADATAGEAPTMTHRAAYVAALPITVGLYGALYQYLRTGEGPQDLKDYFYPKTGDVDNDGNAQRVQLPSYMKDLVAYAGSPWQTVKHKTAPILSATVEMLQNEDFYGDQIRNPNDDLVQQLMQEATYIGKTTLPFSWRNFKEQDARGDESPVTALGNVVGITPAPRRAVRSDAENLMADMLASKRSSGATPEEAEARKARADILNRLRLGDVDAAQQAVEDAIQNGQVTNAQVRDLMRRAGMTPAQERYKRLTAQQAWEVYKAATPKEQAKFRDILKKKLARAFERGEEVQQ